MTERSESLENRKVEKDMDVNKNLIIERWKFMDHKKYLIYDLDKCVGCSLCYVVCPERAIEMGPVPDIAQKLIEDMPAVLIDTDKCSFCFMCVSVCINSVYEIADELGQPIHNVDFPLLRQMWVYDKSTCKKDEKNEMCKKCSEIRDPVNIERGRHHAKELIQVVNNCPTQSMTFISPFEGEVVILKEQLYKCDPNGCKACVNICPTESFFIPQTAEEVVKYGKIACNEETCMYCGACENACPEEIIIVRRFSVDLIIPEQSKNKPWMSRWKKQFNDLTLSREELLENLQREEEFVIIQPDDGEIDFDYDKITPEIPFSIETYAEIRTKNEPVIQKMKDNFDKANVRIFIHHKKKDKLRKYLKKQQIHSE
ncbi:MAG: 4Fe-4S dicluster domain-containing protein [Candidatus Lokiarchaeota archaeon]|nr:4Fe-4S dicluster domain-containing protein [Candidatus Lokiarchaeota archaeon]